VFDDRDSGDERRYIGDADSVRNIVEGDGARGNGAGFGGFCGSGWMGFRRGALNGVSSNYVQRPRR
jgi:hypothetical protein